MLCVSGPAMQSDPRTKVIDSEGNKYKTCASNETLVSDQHSQHSMAFHSRFHAPCISFVKTKIQDIISMNYDCCSSTVMILGVVVIGSTATNGIVHACDVSELGR